MRLDCAGILVLAFMTAGASSAYAADPKASEDLYKAKCAKCHGADGTATAAGKKFKALDLYHPDVIKKTDAEWIEMTKKGKEKMPAFEKSLTDDQINGLVAYMRQLAKSHDKK